MRAHWSADVSNLAQLASPNCADSMRAWRSATTAVPSAPGAASVPVWQVMSRGRDPSTVTGPKPGAPAAGGRSCCLSSPSFCPGPRPWFPTASAARGATSMRRTQRRFDVGAQRGRILVARRGDGLAEWPRTRSELACPAPLRAALPSVVDNLIARPVSGGSKWERGPPVSGASSCARDARAARAPSAALIFP